MLKTSMSLNEKALIENIFNQLLGKFDALSATKILLNLGVPFKVEKHRIIFLNPQVDKPINVTIDSDRILNWLIGLLQTYQNHFDNKVARDYLKHYYTKHLSDRQKSGLGMYYTPAHLVELVGSLVYQYVKSHSVILDPAAGCGAFLGYFKNHTVIGRDIDKNAVEVLRLLGFKNVDIDNSLINVNRRKYNLRDDDHLVIVGNPPYNDVTSRNKKYGKNAKIRIKIPMDDDIRTNDLGISFLRAFNKLRADVICVLHPLSYLIKPANFKKLGLFPRNYILKRAVIFSSKEFPDVQKTPFPVVAALYLRDAMGMDYSYIYNFKFEVYKRPNIKFVLNNIETTDGYIRKYPPRRSDPNKKSDISLYMYNFRDINSLLTTANLTEKENFSTHITINYKDLYKYAYLNAMKRYFRKDFLFGNLSPIVDKEELENNEFLKDLFIIDTIINNQKISAFNINNPNSIIYTKGLYEDYKLKKSTLKDIPVPIYTIFLDFVEGRPINKDIIARFIVEYFEKLKEKMLIYEEK